MSLTSECGNTTMLVEPACGYNNGGNGWGGDWGSWIILFLIFGIFGGWGGYGGFGGGYGGQQGYDTRAEIQRGFDTSEVFSKLNGLENGLCDGFYAVNTAFGNLNNTLATNFAGVQNTLTQGFAGINTGMVTQGYENRLATQTLGAQLADCCCGIKGDIKDNTTQGVMNTAAIQASIKDCCCENEKIAMQSRFDAAQNNCATLQAIDKVGDRIIDYMASQNAQNLRDENFALKLAASQANQNNYLVNQLKPCPVPAYITCNPYTASYGVGFNNGGCGCAA